LSTWRDDAELCIGNAGGRMHPNKQITIFCFAMNLTALAACNTRDSELPIETATTRSNLVTDCDYLNPGLFPPLPVAVDYPSELMITDINVVEDPCRTTWFPAGGCSPWSVGAWTFGWLMEQMAGTWPPSEFVGEWMNSLEVGGSVNGFPVSPRPGLRPQVIDPWLIASGCAAGDPIVGPGACALDLHQAPFRLLAIVNRLDLAGNSYGGRSTGEGRFVFGFVGPRGRPLRGTVIFEYRLDAGMDIFSWAAHWHVLSSLPIGSPAYNDHLQSVTDRFVLAGMSPGSPNRSSSIGQIRTNEIAFGPDWILREFTLQDVGLGIDQFLALPDTIKQNPDDSFNLTPTLDAWLVANELDILDVNHVVPNSFLGGETHVTFFWDNAGSSGPISPMARHLFGFATCNGCHFDETATGFTHVDVRPAGSPSALSPFMNAPTAPGGGGGLPAGFFTFSDPTGLVVEYNEPWRRICEETRILNGDPIPFTKANGAH
jgi:hypothetical protein